MDLYDYNTIKRILTRHGFTFSKALGQNFLIDPSVCPRMAAALEADDRTGVLEIGPGIGTMSDQLGGRLAADGPQQFVLHDFEKLDRLFSFRVVVDARRVDVLDLLVEHPFRKADFADALLQFVEIVHRLARLHPFVVQCEALDEVFAQHLRRPDAELRALVRFPSATAN